MAFRVGFVLSEFCMALLVAYPLYQVSPKARLGPGSLEGEQSRRAGALAEAAFLASWREDTRSWQGGRRLRKWGPSPALVTRPACLARVAAASGERVHGSTQGGSSQQQPGPWSDRSLHLLEPSLKAPTPVSTLHLINISRYTKDI